MLIQMNHLLSSLVDITVPAFARRGRGYFKSSFCLLTILHCVCTDHLYMHCGSQKLTVSSFVMLHPVFQDGLSVNLKSSPFCLDWQASKPIGSAYLWLNPPPQCWGYRCVPLCWDFTWNWGSKLRSSCSRVCVTVAQTCHILGLYGSLSESPVVMFSSGKT